MFRSVKLFGGNFKLRHTGLQQLRRNYHDLPTLTQSIDSKFTGEKDFNEETILRSINDLNKYRRKTNSKELKEIDALFTKIINHPNLALNEQLLDKIVKLNLQSSLNVILFEIFNKHGNDNYIPKQIALSALRRSLYNDLDTKSAIRITELTASSPNYIKYLEGKRNSLALKLIGGGFGGWAIVEIGLRSLSLNPSIGVYSMIISYIVNVTFFGFLSFGGKFLQTAEHIQWIQGTTTNTRYIYSDQMVMLSKIAEIDILTNGTDGFTSDEFSNKVLDYNLEVTQPKSEMIMEEYWLTGGENFQWTEPDQDPAEIILSQRLDAIKPDFIEKKGVDWADRLIKSEHTDINNVPA